jgi:hypothetical protein
MRNLILVVSVITTAALVAASSVSSAVAVLEHSSTATAPSAQHHPVRVADNGRALRHGPTPLFMP